MLGTLGCATASNDAQGREAYSAAQGIAIPPFHSVEAGDVGAKAPIHQCGSISVALSQRGWELVTGCVLSPPFWGQVLRILFLVAASEDYPRTHVESGSWRAL